MRNWLKDKAFKRNVMNLFIITQMMLILLGGVGVYDSYRKIADQRERGQLQIYDNFERIEEEYQRRYETITNDLLYLSEAYVLKDYIACPTEEHYLKLRDEWILFFNYHTIYDQICYLDESGQEVVRINYKDGKGEGVERERLQDKGGRYYFVESMWLKEKEVYVSRIDLNIENQQIEEPIKPMMRFATPVYTSDGTPKGVVVFNYYAKRLLDQLQVLQRMFKADLQVLNEEGYWLYHGNEPELCWGFMYGDVERKLGYRKPELMREIKMSAGEPHTYYGEEGGVYYYKKLMNKKMSGEMTPNQDKYLILLTHMPNTIDAYRHPNCFISAVMTFFDEYKGEMLLIWLASFSIVVIGASFMTVRKKQKVLETTMDHYYKVILEIVEFMENDNSLEVRLTNHNFDGIQSVAEKLAHQLGLEKHKIEEIRKYAAIHDIGKIGVDRAILQKPGRLNEEERKEMQRHVTIGAKLLEKVLGKSNQVATNIVTYHHEAWDGTGYESNLKGEWIPIEARIIAIVDIYDALRSKRAYKEAFSHEEAMEIIRNMKGTKLDPNVVGAFEVLSKEIEAIYD
ncbi:MAG: HD-GYP domain-containing protein [Cellulosilyticaceae bacterium]